MVIGMTQECRLRKKELRRELLQKRDKLGEAAQIRAEVLITERILGHQWFYGSEILLGFASFGSEIRTRQIIEEAVRKGKQVYLPKVEGDEMRFYLADLSTCKTGYHGIPEPVGDTKAYEYSDDMAKKTLLLMPGVGFDPYRNRLGYGKGFYDRFLADKQALQIRSIAIGHLCQMTEEIPCDDLDLKPYQVILV